MVQIIWQSGTARRKMLDRDGYPTEETLEKMRRLATEYVLHQIAEKGNCIYSAKHYQERSFSAP